MKIAVIGGAGVRTVIFINGLLKRCHKLHIDEVALYDINREKLQIIEKLCTHVVRRGESDLKVYAAEDAKEAVMGADYVVTTLRVGGDHSRTVDEEIALRCGVIGQETTGVGGFSMAARTIPVLLEYCGLIKKYAPNAWIFNFTNPSGLVTQALKNAGYDRVIGICDAPSSTKFRMAKYLNVPEEELYVEFFGLNHLSWIRSVKLSGKEMLGELLEDNAFLEGVEEFQRFEPGVLRLTGLLPNEYLYYYYHREKALENIKKAGSARGRNIEEINRKMFQELQGMDADSDPEEMLQTFLYYMQQRENSYMAVETGGKGRPMKERGQLPVPEGIGYAGVMLDCIEGMQSEKGRYLVLSVENRGALPQLGDRDVVEMTCLVSKEGIQPVKVENPPEDCMVLIRNIKHYERLAAEAIVEQSREKAVRALMLHPLINSYSLADKLLTEYGEAYGGLFGES
nr:glycoside hydrolase [uncultured Acetatifactor sp.]